MREDGRICLRPCLLLPRILPGPEVAEATDQGLHGDGCEDESHDTADDIRAGDAEEALHHLGAHAKGIDYIDFMKGKKLESPRGPIMIDPETRDIIENVYIRKVEKVNGQLTNVDVATIPMVKDPWKIAPPLKK